MDVLQRFRNNQFLRHNTVFFLGSVAVGALNYLYYPVLGRLLAPSSFGEVQTLVSLFLQLSIFLTVLSLVTVNIVANAGSDNARNEVAHEFERLALVVSFVVFFLTLCLQWKLQGFLQFDSPWPFALLGLALVVTVPFILRGALLRAKQRFGLVSAGNIIAAGAKIVFSVVLVLIGWGTIGAIGGLVIAQVVACIFIARWTFKLGLHQGQGTKFKLPNMRMLAPELKYGFFVLLGSMAITLQYSLDIIVVKHYFDAHTAGLYAGVSSVARVVFFLTASIAQVLISSVRIREDAKKNTQILFRSLVLLIGLGGPVLLLLIAVPKTIIHVLMGSAYGAMSPLLPRLGVAIFIVSILNLLVSYHLALRRYSVAVAAFLGVLLTYALIAWNHQTPSAVVGSLLTGSVAMLGIYLIWLSVQKVKGGLIWRTRS